VVRLGALGLWAFLSSSHATSLLRRGSHVPAVAGTDPTAKEAPGMSNNASFSTAWDVTMRRLTMWNTPRIKGAVTTTSGISCVVLAPMLGMKSCRSSVIAGAVDVSMRFAVSGSGGSDPLLIDFKKGLRTQNLPALSCEAMNTAGSAG
jgi:hypothetical protein